MQKYEDLWREIVWLWNIKTHIATVMPTLGTTAVKRLNRYFCFLLLGFHLPVSEKWQRCINQLVNITIFPFFSKFRAFFAENASREKKIMLENGADNNVSVGFQSFRTFLVN